CFLAVTLLGREPLVEGQYLAQERPLLVVQLRLLGEQLTDDVVGHRIERVPRPVAGPRLSRPRLLRLGQRGQGCPLRPRRDHGLPDRDGSPYQERRGHRRRRQHRRPVPPGELPQLVRRRRRPGQDRLVAQVAPEVRGEVPGRPVAAVAGPPPPPPPPPPPGP